jgi:CRISPR-associated protein Csb2
LVAERVHFALVDLSNGSSVFTGCDSNRQPLQGHRHAYVFCESHPDSIAGEITSAIVYSRMGFDSKDQEALQSLGRVWGPDLEVSLTLQKMGRPEDFADESPLLARSRSWVSRTPFLLGRHAKRTRAGVPKCDEQGLQIGGPEHELRRLLKLAKLQEPQALEDVAGTLLGGREVAWREFLRQRERGAGRQVANGAGYGFRIEFAEAVQGPVAVGYASHFGMGGFQSEDGCRYEA